MMPKILSKPEKEKMKAQQRYLEDALFGARYTEPTIEQMERSGTFKSTFGVSTGYDDLPHKDKKVVRDKIRNTLRGRNFTMDGAAILDAMIRICGPEQQQEIAKIEATIMSNTSTMTVVRS